MGRGLFQEGENSSAGRYRGFVEKSDDIERFVLDEVTRGQQLKTGGS